MLKLLVGVTVALACLVAACGAAASSSTAGAAGGEHRVSPAGRVLLVLCESPQLSTGARQKLLSAVAAELSELDVGVQGTPPLRATELRGRIAEAAQLASAHEADAIVWLEDGTEGVRIYLFEARGPHLRQRLIRGGGSSEGAIEEVTVVLRSALTAIVEDMEAGLSEVAWPWPRENVASKAQEPAAAGVDDGSTAAPGGAENHQGLVGVRVAYAGSSYAAGAPWQHGVSVGLQLRPWRGFMYLDLSHTFFQVIRLDAAFAGADVNARIERRPTELFFGAELSRGALRWGPEVGVLVDAVERTSAGVSESFVAAERSRRWQGALGARLRIAWRFDGGFGFTSSVGADFPLRTYGHVAVAETGTVTLLEQRAVRPRLDVGAYLAVW